MNTIEFGKFIANLRNEKKLTQEDLADKLFIDKRKISRWECGMSLPDFDMLIKLSEIFDISLYELSICKKLEKEKISTRLINKFKGIKDFKKYQLKRKILIILTILLGIFFIFTTIYTFKYYGTVKIYEFKSLDKDYEIEGIYLEANDYIIYSISDISSIKHDEEVFNELNSCTFEIYNNNYRVLRFINVNPLSTNNIFTDHNLIKSSNKLSMNTFVNKPLKLKIICTNNNIKNDYFINFKLVKKYANELF